MSHKLLFIEASPRRSRSASTVLGQFFIDQVRQSRRDVEVDHMRLWEETLPELDGDLLSAKYAILAKKDFGQNEADAWAHVVGMIDRIRGADSIVIATPMWNFGVPYKLKHWLDLVTQPGQSFAFDPATGYRPLLPARPVTVVLASSGDYSAGPSWGRLDLASPYLREALAFIGLKDVQIVGVGPTAGDPELQERGRRIARERLAGLVAQQGYAP